MKRLLIILFVGCIMVAACGKEKENDPLENTVWQSGHYSENTGEAVAHGIVYYGDGDVCREVIEFKYGFADRYLTYLGEKIRFMPGGQYEIKGNEIIIPKDTAHAYFLEDNRIVSYFLDGRENGVFYKIK